MAAQDALSLANPVFSVFVSHAAILLIKTCLMSVLTGVTRLRKKAFANEEDASHGKAKKVTSDPDVERIRRAHLNDMENIFPFLFLGMLYVASGPGSTAMVCWHFRLFTLLRLTHTVVYLLKVPQPARGYCFLAGLGVNLSMAGQILWKAASF